MSLAVTYFNEETWKNLGVNWLRQAKSAGYKGYVIAQNLANEAISKINELGFDAYDLCEETNTEFDVYSTFIKYIKPEESYLFTLPHVFPQKMDLEEKVDCVCGLTEKTILEIVTTIINLQDRANAYPMLENVKNDHGKLLSADFILGNYDFWTSYKAFQSYIVKKKYLERKSGYDDFMLNFFVANIKSIKIQIAKV